jgi:hypothetical protein
VVIVFITTMGEKEMKTKTILSIAIMAALPFGAHADPVGPAAVPANGTAVVATANAPYVTQTPTAADATHIASTAYVKGAYNDAIAAVNKVNSELISELISVNNQVISTTSNVALKQDQLVSENNNAMYNKVLAGGNNSVLGEALMNVNNNDYAALKEDIARQLSDGETDNPDEILISTGATLQIVRDAGRYLDGRIDTVQSSVSGVQTALNNKRVEIYTTWENDNAKQQVAFVNAQ